MPRHSPRSLAAKNRRATASRALEPTVRWCFLSDNNPSTTFVDVSSDHDLASPFWKPVLAWLCLAGASLLDLCALSLLTFWLPLAVIGYPLAVSPFTLIGVASVSMVLGYVGLSLGDSRSGWSRIAFRWALLVAKSLVVLCIFFLGMTYLWNYNRLIPTEPVPLWLPCTMLALSIVAFAILVAFYQPGRTQARHLIAALLMTASVSLFVLFGFLAPLVYALAAMGGEAPSSLVALLLGILSSPIVFVIGLIIRGPSKQLVVFLRRFGHEEVNMAIRETIQQELSSEFRLITLDDASFKSAGTPLRDRIVASGGIGLASLSVLSALVGMGWLIAQLKTANEMPGDIKEPGSGAIGGIEGWMYDIFLNRIQEGLILLPLYYAAVLLSLFIVVLFVKGKKRRRIRSARDIVSAQLKLKKLKLRRRAPSFLGSQAVLLSVVDQLWRDTVLSMLRIADSVVVEISTPSESIAWEMAQIKSGFSGNVVLLAQRDAIVSWLNQTSESKATPSGEVRRNMAGLDVLVYDAPLSIDLKKLASFWK